MKKRVLATTLVLLISSVFLFANGGSDESAADSVGFNATGLPIVDEMIEVEMMGIHMNNTRQGRWDETEMMKWLEEQTNIKVTWTMVPQDSWQEKKNLIVASGDLPDAFHARKSLSADEIQKFGADGALIPLDDLIDQYAPNIKSRMSPIYDAFVRSMDGNLYSLASIEDNGFDSFNSAIIKTEWLDNLGLDMPTTTDEFYETLVAFKTQDPNRNGKADEIPWSFLYKENPPVREVKREHYWIFPAFGIQDNPLHITIEDGGEVIFTANKEEWKDAVQYLSMLYSEGLIDPEVFSQDRATLTNKVRNLANVGAYTDYRYRFSIANPEIEHLFGIMPPLEGPNGDKGWMRAMIGFAEGTFAITSSAEHPEALMRWLDFINEGDNTVQMSYGMFKPEGYTDGEALVPDPAAPGKYRTNQGDRPESVKPSEWPFTAPLVVAGTLLTNDIMDEYISGKASNIAKAETCDVYRPYLSEYPYNYPYKFSADEIEELSLIQTDLLSFIYTTQAKWIVNGFSEADWNSYVGQLDNLGVDRYLELYQTAFARQN